MNKGKVKWFDPKKGYGFLEPDDWSKDVFVHISEVERMGLDNIAGNTRLGYDLVEERGKLTATNLRLI
jgi:CspA family cold shock protein